MRQKSLEFLISARQGDVSGVARTVAGLKGIGDTADRTGGRLEALSQKRLGIEESLQKLRSQQEGISADVLRRERALAEATEARAKAEADFLSKRSAANAAKGNQETSPAAVKAREESREQVRLAKLAERSAERNLNAGRGVLEANRQQREQLVQQLRSVRDRRTIVGGDRAEQLRGGLARVDDGLDERERAAADQADARSRTRHKQEELDLLQRQKAELAEIRRLQRSPDLSVSQRDEVVARRKRLEQVQAQERSVVAARQAEEKADTRSKARAEQLAVLDRNRLQTLQREASLGDRNAQRQLKIRKLFQEQARDRKQLLEAAEREIAAGGNKERIQKRISAQIRRQAADHRALLVQLDQENARLNQKQRQEAGAVLRQGRIKDLEIQAALGDRHAATQLRLVRLFEQHKQQNADLLALAKDQNATARQREAAEKRLLSIQKQQKAEIAQARGTGAGGRFGRAALTGAFAGGSFASAGPIGLLAGIAPGLAGGGGALGGAAAGAALGGAAVATAGVAVAAGAIAFGLVKSVEAARNLEFAMSEVQAVMGLTAEQAQPLKEQAEALGQATTFNPQQVVGAQANLARAGFDSEQTIQATPAVLALAEAGAIDLAEAGQIVTTVMAGMGIAAKDAALAVDVLAAASTSSATTIPELGVAYEFVGPAAKVLNKDIEQTTALLQVLANAGLRGEKGGTALRQVFIKLAGQTVEGAEALERAGIELKTAQGNLKDIPDILDQFNEALAGRGDAERLEFLSTVFEARAANAFAALLEKGGDEARRFEAGLRGAQGRAQELADTRFENLLGETSRLGSAALALGVTVGEIALDPLSDLVRLLASATQGINSLVKGAVSLAEAFHEMDTSAVSDLIGAGGDSVARVLGSGSDSGVKSGQTSEIVDDFIKSFFTRTGPAGLVFREIKGLGDARRADFAASEDAKKFIAEAQAKAQAAETKLRRAAQAEVTRNVNVFANTKEFEEEVERVIERLREGTGESLASRQANLAKLLSFNDEVKSEIEGLLPEDPLVALNQQLQKFEGLQSERDTLLEQGGLESGEARRLDAEAQRAYEARLAIEEKIAEIARQRSEEQAQAAEEQRRRTERGQELILRALSDGGSLGAAVQLARQSAQDPLRDSASDLREAVAEETLAPGDTAGQARQAADLALADRLEQAADRAAQAAEEATVRAARDEVTRAVVSLRQAALGDRLALAEEGSPEAQGAAAALAALRVEQQIAARREQLNELLESQVITEELRARAMRELSSLEQREGRLIARARDEVFNATVARPEPQRFDETPAARFLSTTSRDIEFGAGLSTGSREEQLAERSARAAEAAAASAKRASAGILELVKELKRQGQELPEIVALGI